MKVKAREVRNNIKAIYKDFFKKAKKIKNEEIVLKHQSISVFNLDSILREFFAKRMLPFYYKKYGKRILSNKIIKKMINKSILVLMNRLAKLLIIDVNHNTLPKIIRKNVHLIFKYIKHKKISKLVYLSHIFYLPFSINRDIIYAYGFNREHLKLIAKITIRNEIKNKTYFNGKEYKNFKKIILAEQIINELFYHDLSDNYKMRLLYLAINTLHNYIYDAIEDRLIKKLRRDNNKYHLTLSANNIVNIKELITNDDVRKLINYLRSSIRTYLFFEIYINFKCRVDFIYTPKLLFRILSHAAKIFIRNNDKKLITYLVMIYHYFGYEGVYQDED